jgi:hypothetical protein
VQSLALRIFYLAKRRETGPFSDYFGNSCQVRQNTVDKIGRIDDTTIMANANNATRKDETMLTVEALPKIAGSKEQTALVKLEDKVVGYLRKFVNTRTERCPWQAFAMDGTHPQTGEPCVGTLVGSFFGRAAKREAIEAIEAQITKTP